VSPTGTAVLNAADPLVVKMAETCPGNILFFAATSENEILHAHCRKGGKGLLVRDGSIWTIDGGQESKFIDLKEVPLTWGGTISFQVENTLAALGSAWALGIDPDLIRKGLRSFAPGFDQNAGRFNVLDIQGITVVCDYGHNIDALRALLQSLRHFPNQRRIVVYSSAGDRRDEDIIIQGQMLSTEFDEAWLYEGDYVRGRESGEIMALLAKGLQNAQRTQRVESILGHLKAVDLAIASAKPGDLVMIQADTADETVQHLQQRYLNVATSQVSA
jgi:cyanophycin synthetase